MSARIGYLLSARFTRSNNILRNWPLAVQEHCSITSVPPSASPQAITPPAPVLRRTRTPNGAPPAEVAVAGGGQRFVQSLLDVEGSNAAATLGRFVQKLTH